MEGDTDIDRIGATESREAMRMPISQIPAVSSRAQVGSPLAFPCPNTYEQTQQSVKAEAHQDGKLLGLHLRPVSESNLQEGDNAIPCNSLQQAGGAGQTLQTRPTAGEERPDHNDPGRGPRQGADDKVPLDRVAESAMQKQLCDVIWLFINTVEHLSNTGWQDKSVFSI